MHGHSEGKGGKGKRGGTRRGGEGEERKRGGGNEKGTRENREEKKRDGSSLFDLYVMV